MRRRQYPRANKLRAKRGKEVRCSVYVVVEQGTDYCKIGMGVCSDRRLIELQIGNPRRLQLAATFELGDVATAARIERRVHSLLAEYRHQGEWFKVSSDQARASITQALAEMGRAHVPSLKPNDGRNGGKRPGAGRKPKPKLKPADALRFFQDGLTV